MPRHSRAWQKGRSFVVLTGFLFCLLPSLTLVAGGALADPACATDALGVTRQLTLGTEGGFAIGLKTYPQTLDLADHEVVLTFDDGPLPGTTPLVLDALAKQCVRATFFLIGRNAAAYPSLVRRALAGGHTLGHHSFSHPAKTLRLMSDAAAQADIDKGFAADDTAAYSESAAAKSALVPKVRFFRFPGFADTPHLNAWLESSNIGIFSADVWASDWRPLTPDAERDLILTRLEKDGRGILLLHDTRRSTALMLPQLLTELKRRGFHIVHLVADAGPPPHFRQAPEGWTSETETNLNKLLPNLKRLNARKPRRALAKVPPQIPEMPEPRSSIF
jgi:peptidoglycan/xylan/chitin deacetylase (PgdA/CDA1 family)